jgi:predicted nuclease of restriction endonuclease-like (RecB) superfamily
VKEGKIASILTKGTGIMKKLKEIIQVALEAGGHDNINKFLLMLPRDFLIFIISS